MNYRHRQQLGAPSWADAAPIGSTYESPFRARKNRRDEDNEAEWLGEVSRSSSSYVRWLQSSLNRLIAAGLVVDGVSGAKTREAVVNFQRRQGLTADGVVGPITESALVAAGAAAPPGSTAGSSPGAPSPSTGTGRFFKDVASFAQVRLAPVQPVAISSSWPSARRSIAAAYNRLGGLMGALASAVGADLASVLAVWQVESGSRVHQPGTAVVRFENHKFFDLWGARNTKTFDTYFKFGSRNGQSGERWKNHEFRTNPTAAFAPLHTGAQSSEYAALQLAMQLAGDELAIQAISIGGPQILGSNYRLIGYGSAEDMYDAFQQDERWHVLGFFDFCKATGILGHLAAKRWTDFAYKYNGSGQAATYAGLIAAAYKEATALSLPQPSRVVPPTAPTSTPTAPYSGGATASPGREPTVKVNPGVVISSNAVQVLKDLLRAAGLSSATVTSGRRDASEQARVMYNLIESNSVAYAKDLYGSSGDKVIDVYASNKAAGRGADQIKAAMRAKIIELGPSNVSHHASETHDVFDVAPSSIANQTAFRQALDAALAAGVISRYIPPPGDPAYHIEILLTGQREASSVFEAPPLAPVVLLQEAEYAAGETESQWWEAERPRRSGSPSQIRRSKTSLSRSITPKLPPKRPGWGSRPRFPVAVPYLAAWPTTASVATTVERPACTEAEVQVRRLAELLARHLTAAGPAVEGVTSAILELGDGLIARLPELAVLGCSRCHLTRLATRVDGLTWPRDPRLQELKGRLLAALADAERSSSNDSASCD